MELIVRPFGEDDIALVPQITALLHRAYRPLAEGGMRFYASHQDDTATLDRITKGLGFLGFVNERLVATITLYPPGAGHRQGWYAEHLDAAVFGQFGVDPDSQGRGIGDRLLAHVEHLAGSDLRATQIACDTSERAHRLIGVYERRGYRRVGTTQWNVTNYRSVILSKPLACMAGHCG